MNRPLCAKMTDTYIEICLQQYRPYIYELVHYIWSNSAILFWIAAAIACIAQILTYRAERDPGATYLAGMLTICAITFIIPGAVLVVIMASTAFYCIFHPLFIYFAVILLTPAFIAALIVGFPG